MNPSDILQGGTGFTLQGSSPTIQAGNTNLQAVSTPLQGSTALYSPTLRVSNVPEYRPISIAPVPDLAPLSVQRMSPDWLGPDQAFNPFIEEDDINYFISDGTQSNPLTGKRYDAGQIVFEGPDWLVNNKLFEESIRPRLERPVQYDDNGKPIHDILTSEFSQQLKSLEDSLKLVGQHRNVASEVFGGDYLENVTDDDMMLALRNIGQSERHENDTNNFLVIGVGKDGRQITKTVAESIEELNNMDTLQRARLVRNYTNIIKGNSTSKQKAIAYGMLGFIESKGYTNATRLAQLGAGTVSFAAGTLDALAGIGNFLTLGKIDALRDVDYTKEFRDATLESGLASMGGISGAMSVGEFGGAAVPYLIPVGGWAGGGVRVASRLPKIGGALRSVSLAVDGLKGGGLLSRGLRRSIQSIGQGLPSDLLYGISRAGQDSMDRPLSELGWDVAGNAAIPWASKGAGRVIRPLADAPVARRASAALHDYGVLGMQALDNVPGVRRVIDTVRTIRAGGIDSATKIRLEARRGVARLRRDLVRSGDFVAGGREDPIHKYYELSNAISVANRNGAPIIDNFNFNNALLTREVGQTMKKIEDLKAMDDFDEYMVARSKLNDHRFTEAKSTKDEVEYFESVLAEHIDNEDFNNAYNAMSVYARKFQDEVGVGYGIMGEKQLAAIRSNPDYAMNWVPLRAATDDTKLVRRVARKPREITPIRGRKGLAQEYQSALTGLENFRIETARNAADNRVRQSLLELRSMGTSGIEVLADPKAIAKRDALEKALKDEKSAIKGIFENNTDLDNSVNVLIQQVEDVEDLFGAGGEVIRASVKNVVDNAVSVIESDARFSSILDAMAEDLGGDRRGAAREILNSYRNDFSDTFQNRLKESLGSEDREFIKGIFDDYMAPDSRRLARASDAGFTVDVTDEFGDPFQRSPENVNELGDQFQTSTTARIKERNEARKALDKEINLAEGEGNVISYFEDGVRGRIKVDDPLIAQFFNSVGQTEYAGGHIAKLAQTMARLFRAGTILSPTFPVRNLARDVGRSSITNSLQWLDPATNLGVLLKNANIPESEATRIIQEISASGAFTRGAMGRSASKVPFLNAALEGSTDRGARIMRLTNEARDDPVKILEKVQDVIEQYSRERNGVLAYTRALSQGASEQQALEAAKFFAAESTANFANHGAYLQQFIRTLPFMNAALQGSDSFFRLATLDPVGTGVRLAAGIGVPVTYMMLHNLQDPEMATAYFDIPEWERRANFILMLTPNDRLQIPMDQELANWVNPIIQSIEALKGSDQSVFDVVADFAVGVSPLDVSGFRETGYSGGLNVGLGLSRLVNQFVPQLATPVWATVAGTDPYSGNPIGPQEMVYGGAGEQTFKSKDSKTLRWFANLTNIPQSTLQQIVSGYGGAVGDNLLNALDTFLGAPEDQQGGRSVLDHASQTLFGRNYSQSQSDFYNMVGKFESKKASLQKHLDDLYKEYVYSGGQGGEELYASKRQALIDTYGDELAKEVEKFGRFYQNVGGLKPYQADSIIRLLNFGPSGQGSFSPGTANAEQMQQAIYAGQEEARARAQQIGLPDANIRDRFGQTRVTEQGDVYTDYGNVSLAGRILTDVQYGAPEQMLYEFEQNFKGDKNANIPSMREIYNAYRDMMDPLYTRAEGQTGDAKSATYDEITALQHEYLGHLGNRLEPMLAKYGVNSLRNNRQILEEVAKYVMVPGDFTPFAPGRNKQPYMTRDAAAFIADYYGVGNLNASNLPTDESVIAGIRQATQDLDDGKTSSALFRLQRLQNNIDQGINYADYNNMAEIRRLIELANGKRR